MNKLLLITLLSIIAFNINCQKHELSINYSPLSIYGLEKMVDGKGPGQSKYFVLGALNADYYTYLNDWLKLGINVMYDRAHAEGVASTFGFGYSSQISDFKYSATKTAFVCASQIDFEYLRHPKFKLSSGFSVGYGFEHLVNSSYISTNANCDGLSIHLNLLSFRWGRKHGLTGNMGLGYKG